MKKYISFTLTILCTAMLIGCGGGNNAAPSKPVERKAVVSSEIQFDANAAGTQQAIISTSVGDITVALYPHYAPQAVENFIGLAQSGYFNGVIFHRVVQNSIIQSGDDTGTGSGGSTIWNNNPFGLELTDKLHHYSGALSMARLAGDVNSNLSQFFIVQTPQNNIDKDMQKTLTDIGTREAVVNTYKDAGGLPSLDGQYTVFGQVISGMEYVDAIGFAKVDVERPVEDIIINSITIQ